ncbi:MAG: cysteine synthase A [Polyangiales bacterium]
MQQEIQAPWGGAVVDDALALVGQTPLVRLRHVGPAEGAQIWAKAEHLNPGGSVKDRPCLRMIEAAEAAGALRPGDWVVEPTSGNTGIALAWICAVKGYRLALAMPASMSLERRALLEAFGAELILTEPKRAMAGAIEAAAAFAQARGAFMPQQFDNPHNPEAHADSTATEIMTALDGQAPAAFVAAVGTGGTVSGVGRVLKAAAPMTEVIAVEPATSAVLSGGCPGPTKLQGIGAGFVPANYNSRVVDRVVTVTDRDAHRMKQALAQREGLLVGMTAAANVMVARAVAARLAPEAMVVTILCDTGEREFSLNAYFAD